MNPPSADSPAAARPAWPRRLHAALMPDYNPRASFYWWAMVLLGAAAVGWALTVVAAKPAAVALQVAAASAIAMLAGFFPVRIPNSKNSFAAGEIFIFLTLLLHGPEAAALAAAGESAVGSWRTSRRWTSRIVSPALSGLSMLVMGKALFLVLGSAPPSAPLLVVGSIVTALGYFLLNTLLVTAVPRLKNNQPLQWSDLFGVFGWVGIAFSGSAAVAALLFLVYRQSGFGVLAAMVPVIAMMLATLHYFFRQQEAAETVRLAGAEAAERERELAARHVRELEASERRFHSAFTHASIGMALLSFDAELLQANPALRVLLGRTDVLGQPFLDFVVDDDRDALARELRRVESRSFEGFALELRCRHRDGGEVWVAVHCSFFSEPGEAAPCLILQVQDITARRMAEQELQHIAFHDGLTGLPNRRCLQGLLARAIARARADPEAAFAVMFLDFDRFKLINDSLGHDAGDKFLVQVAERIRTMLRPEDVVARLGGDEFAVLAQSLDHERSAVALAERLMAALREPFHVAGNELTTSASIGITFSALGYTCAEEVLRDADIAMYKAKGAGKARYALFDASLHTEVAGRLRLEGELRRALDQGRLTVAYQPLFCLDTGRTVGFEALARWHHPDHGSIEPATFLPVAEDAGLMPRLTDFMLHCACHQLRACQDRAPLDAPALTMSVNVSGPDIVQRSFVARVTRAVVEAGVRTEQLCIELTENILASHMEAALPVLLELRRLGVRLAIDDFGTGYSSLSHLAQLPIDELKIDRSFVARLGEGSNEAAVVRSVVLLGLSLGKRVVAEGIETPVQGEQLRELGCRVGQGFLLARPLAPDELPPEGLPIAAWRPAAVHTGSAALFFTSSITA